MTTTNISIQDLVQREVIYCVSSLVHTLTKGNKLNEEQALELWTAPIDYGSAKYELELEHDYVFKHFCTEDNKYYFGVRNKDAVWRIDPIHNDEETAIYEWFEIYRGGSLDDYRQEIFEHWIVNSWLGKKLQKQGETVVKDVLGIDYIWGRTTTGQAIWCDYIIQTIYNELISRR
ncbi:MAG: hypothetical protein ACRC2S_18670 [Waterburya sp.]